MRVYLRFAALAIGATLATVLSNPLPATPQATSTEMGAAQPGTWTEKKLHFTYSGFTTRYSCGGLRDKMRQALLQLGARKDLQVREGACTNPSGGPEPFPSVDLTIHTLEAYPPDSHTAPVAAHWARIDLTLDKDPLWQAGDCELIEQVHHYVLPLFATRNVDYHSSCVAHQISPGGTWLRTDVLVPDAPSLPR